MSRTVYSMIVGFLIVLNATVLWQNLKLKEASSLQEDDYNYRFHLDGVEIDLREVGDKSRLGSLTAPKDTEAGPTRSPLTLAIFFSQGSSCPSRLQEIQVYQRLLPIFQERGQRVVAVATDSTMISEWLSADTLGIPLDVYSADHPDSAILGLTYQRLAMSYHNMPFKVLYDSNFNIVYMRGSNYTHDSQLQFEQAMLHLSKSVAEGSHEGPLQSAR